MPQEQNNILRNSRAAILRALQEIRYRSDIASYDAAFAFIRTYLGNMEKEHRDVELEAAFLEAADALLQRQIMNSRGIPKFTGTAAGGTSGRS